MTANAKASFGIELWMAPAGSPLVKVAELLTLKPPARTRGAEDVTSHDSVGGAQEFIPQGTYGNGPVTGQVHHIPDSPGDIALLLALTSGTPQDWKIIFPVGSPRKNISGANAVFTQYDPQDNPVNGKMAAAIELQPSGPVTPGVEGA